MTVKHVVVDGSNLATEGRTLPSLQQLDEAVRAYLEEYKPETVTVVVDASFPTASTTSERAAFEGAVERGRADHAAGRCDRTRRRVPAADRGSCRRRRAVQRLLPGVPRPVRLAVRRGPADRREARAPRRLGVHGALAGPGPAEPPVGERGQEGRQGRAPAKASPTTAGKAAGADGRRRPPRPAPWRRQAHDAKKATTAGTRRDEGADRPRREARRASTRATSAAAK